MGVQTHPTLSLTVIALEASHADSHKFRDHSLQGYLFHATRQGSGSTSSFRLRSRPPLTQQKIRSEDILVFVPSWLKIEGIYHVHFGRMSPVIDYSGISRRNVESGGYW